MKPLVNCIGRWEKSGALAAFDRKTGAVLWTVLPERSSYGSPIIVQLAGARQLIGFTVLRLVSLDASTHTQLWDLPFPAFFEQTITTPLVWKDLVIASGEQKPAVGLRVTKTDEKMSTTPAWQNADIKAYMASPVVFGDHLAGFDSASHRLTCLDLATGSAKWTSDRLGGHVCLIAAGDRILAQTSKGKMVMAKAAPKSYQEIGRWKISEIGETRPYPALSAGRLYVKDKENLLCYDLNGS